MSPQLTITGAITRLRC